MSKVAVLEDNDVMRQVLGEIVAFMGHEVQTFGQVNLFLDSLEANTPDCLIVDAMLPGNANGLDVIERVRLLPGMASSRYVLLTASPVVLPLRHRLHQRHIELLSKPCSLEDLELAIA